MLLDHGLAIGSRVYSAGGELTQPVNGSLEVTRSLPLPAGATLRSLVMPQAVGGGPAVLSWQPAASSVVVDFAAINWRSIVSPPNLTTPPMSVRWEEASTSVDASAFPLPAAGVAGDGIVPMGDRGTERRRARDRTARPADRFAAPMTESVGLSRRGDSARWPFSLPRASHAVRSRRSSDSRSARTWTLRVRPRHRDHASALA